MIRKESFYLSTKALNLGSREFKQAGFNIAKNRKNRKKIIFRVLTEDSK